jgi:hypothetical protein
MTATQAGSSQRENHFRGRSALPPRIIEAMTRLAEQEALRRSFPIGGERFAWGTRFDEVAARYAPTRVGTGGFLDVPCASVLGLDTIGATVHAPPPGAHPIDRLSYALGEGAALHTEAGLARTQAALEQSLGPGRREQHATTGSGDPAGRVRATVTWSLEPVTLTLSAFGGVRTTAQGTSTGALFLSHRLEPLAAPFVARFRAAGALFDDPHVRDTATLVHAAELAPMGAYSPGSAAEWEALTALHHPHLAAAPGWARERLGPADVAIARHLSGAWGIVTRQAMWSTEMEPARVELLHERLLPAKGAGAAFLSTASRELLLSTRRGERGLDLVATRLRALGVQVRVFEDHDV